MIYAGFYTELLSCNPLNPIKMTMVSPSAGNRQLATDCSPSNPMLINERYVVKFVIKQTNLFTFDTTSWFFLVF